MSVRPSPSEAAAHARPRADRLASAALRLHGLRERAAAGVDPDMVSVQVLQVLVEITGSTRGSLMRVFPDSGRLRIVAAVGLPEGIVGQDLPRSSRRISDWVRREGKGLILNGEIRDRRFDGSAPNQIHSAISLPIPGSLGAVGVVNLARTETTPPFDEADLAELEGLAREAAETLSFVDRVHLATHQWAALERSLARATPETVTTRCHQIAVADIRGPRIGGDRVERVGHRDGSQTLLVTDVSGCGGEALARAALVEGLFVAFANSLSSPAEIVAAVDRELRARLPEGAFATLWVAHLAPNGRLVTCCAGAPEPLLVPGEGEPRWLSSGGPLAGALDNSRYEQESVPLIPGDLVIAVSDGLLGASNPAGSWFGRENVEEIAQELRRTTPDRIAARLCAAALEFTGGAVPIDDLLAVAIRYSRDA